MRRRVALDLHFVKASFNDVKEAGAKRDLTKILHSKIFVGRGATDRKVKAFEKTPEKGRVATRRLMNLEAKLSS